MQIPKRRGEFKGLVRDPHLSQKKFDEMKAKLEHLKKVARLRLMKEVSTHAENGDFSENAAYQIAKGKLRGVNDAIHELEEHLKRAIIIPEKTESGWVEIGSRVTIEANGKTKTYTILGSSEVDLTKNIISHNSPLGAALLGKRINERFDVMISGQRQSYRVIAIE